MPKLLRALLCIAALLMIPSAAHASFEWGADCDYGEGTFTQHIRWRNTVEVGVVPEGKRNLRVELTSPTDVDIQLIHDDGTALIRWPDGLLSGAGQDSVTYDGVTYRWSGYNGDGVDYGNEWIEVYGDTNAELTMLAFGYESGDAVVDYSFEPIPTCNEKGDGEFRQNIAFRSSVEVGEIPTNKINVRIELDSSVDVDIQLWAGDVALVAWPYGELNGPGESSMEYRGMTIKWSGYNGDGLNYGNEYIEIWGRVSTPLTMYAFGYESGYADVAYEWGIGAGDTCGGIATLSCKDDLFCKNWQTGVSDPAGSCHGELWCHPDSVAADCQNVIHPAVPGTWACEEFSCAWTSTIPGPTCGTPDAGVDVVPFGVVTNNPDAYLGETIQITWTVDAPLVACTKMYCPGACCNTCQGSLQLMNVGDGETAEAIVLDGLGCHGDECSWEDGCDFELGEIVTVQGTLTESFGRLTLDVTDSCTGQDVTCSMAMTNCPGGMTCEWGCPTAANCGINPPGVCVAD